MFAIKNKFCYNLFGDIMKYPNNSGRVYHKIVNYGNRGNELEYIINVANKYYLENDVAVVYKKATPVTVLKLNNKRITDGFYKEKSTLDYVGVFKGKYIEFDAKKTNLKSLPLSNIHNHQIKHIEKLIKHGGISFLIIQIMEEYYLLKGETLIEFIATNSKKSISYNFIKDNGYKVKYNYIYGLQYMEELEKII